MDRRGKWIEIPEGTEIKAGQPFAVRYTNTHLSGGMEWSVHEPSLQDFVPQQFDGQKRVYYVDSEWKPNLNLPREPVWGIPVTTDSPADWTVGKWRLNSVGDFETEDGDWTLDVRWVEAWVELTPEQIELLEKVEFNGR